MSRNLRVEALLDAIPPDSKILDIGCVQHEAEKAENDDWVHGQLYDISDDVLGLDYREEEVRRLEERGYNVVHGDAEALDLGQRFDVVVAGELIEHLSNIGLFLDGVRDHLRPEGELIMTTPNPWAFHRFKQAFSGEVFANEEHTCWLDERTLRQVLKRHGFQATEMTYVKASDPGITSLLYDLGFQVVGGTSLLVRASPES